MNSTLTRKSPHRWTTFEQDTLLCLICRQIQITGNPSPSRSRKGGHSKTVFDLAISVKKAHSDFAENLNRALNYNNHANDIPVEEVSFMITTLMEQRQSAVNFLERQKISRITRAMKRVWNRGLRFDGTKEVNGRRKDVWASFPLKGKVRSKKRRSKVTVAASQKDSGGVVDSWGDEVIGSMADAQGTTDPWGDQVVSSLNEAQGAMDPWGDKVVTSSTMAQDATDPWGLLDSALVNTMSSSDPWVDISPNFVSAASSDFNTIPDHPRLSVATAPNSPPTAGINPERLAMLDAGDNCEHVIVPQNTFGRGKGENAVKLPFNRLDMMNTKTPSEREAKAVHVVEDDESEISEEE